MHFSVPPLTMCSGKGDCAQWIGEDHPPEVIEVATDIKLRDAFGLSDGDIVHVEVEA